VKQRDRERDRKLPPVSKQGQTTIPAGRAQTIRPPHFASLPVNLATPATLEGTAWRVARAGWIVTGVRSLSAAPRDELQRVAASIGMTVELRERNDAAAMLQLLVTLVGAAVVLAVLALTIGLIRLEATNDMRLLEASGATALARRTMTAATGGTLAFLGAFVGVSLAYLGLLAGVWPHLGRLDNAPIAQLAVLLIGAPALAYVAGLALGGRTRHDLARTMEPI
jgi:putative ABC transport system permease protein